MQAVIETPLFLRRAAEVGMTETERFDLVTFIASNPDAGAIIEGTGGVRKVRFARTGTGKSGGYRVITFFTGPSLPVFLITVYAKSGRENLSKAERNALSAQTAVLVDTYAQRIKPLRRR